MENNGLPLAKKYRDNPDRIFELGETSKEGKGTRLGLWGVKETVERNDGTISVMEKWESFGLESIEYMHEETPEFPVVIMTNTPDKSKESQYTDADKQLLICRDLL